MWIMLNHAFISVVAHKDQPNLLVARARAKGDLQNVFGKVLVTRTPLGDYLYRTTVTREQVEEAMQREINDISYTNFKNSVKEKDRHDAYLRCWSAMLNFQDNREDTYMERRTGIKPKPVRQTPYRGKRKSAAKV